MHKDKILEENDYSAPVVKKRRKFPKKNALILVLLLLVQTGAILFAALFEMKPMDVIREYNVTVRTNTDGTLDVEYDILWQALSDEPLNFVDIGMPNASYTLTPASLSDTVNETEMMSEDGFIGIRLHLADSYADGETVRISYAVTQRRMLCEMGDGYLFEFVPSWFNEIPIESYRFSWKADSEITETPEGATLSDGFYVWEGSFEPGGYSVMRINYSSDAFPDAESVVYRPFSGAGAYNALDDGGAIWAIAGIVVLILVIIEVYLIDSFVSYHRGRGFIVQHGHPINAYGYTNPHYVAAASLYAAQNRNNGQSGGVSGGSSCACACACACAGGGRAGCSVKDGVRLRLLAEEEEEKL